MFEVILIINILIALAIIFLERKDTSATLAWIMVLLFIPILGTIFYIVFSQNISRQKIFRLYENEEEMISASLKKTNRVITKIYNPSDYLFKQLISLNTLKKSLPHNRGKRQTLISGKYRAWGNSAPKEKIGEIFSLKAST